MFPCLNMLDICHYMAHNKCKDKQVEHSSAVYTFLLVILLIFLYTNYNWA